MNKKAVGLLWIGVTLGLLLGASIFFVTLKKDVQIEPKGKWAFDFLRDTKLVEKQALIDEKDLINREVFKIAKDLAEKPCGQEYAILNENVWCIDRLRIRGLFEQRLQQKYPNVKLEGNEVVVEGENRFIERKEKSYMKFEYDNSQKFKLNYDIGEYEQLLLDAEFLVNCPDEACREKKINDFGWQKGICQEELSVDEDEPTDSEDLGDVFCVKKSVNYQFGLKFN